MRMRTIIVSGVALGLLLCVAVLTCHAGAMFTPYLGANAVSFDGDAHLPSDFELGAGTALSLSPHISLTGSGYYGIAREYLRGEAGVRITATDIKDPNFSVGAGMDYVTSTKPEIRPREWCPNMSVGWRPWSEYAPRVALVAQGAYGLTSNQAFLLLGIRYVLREF